MKAIVMLAGFAISAIMSAANAETVRLVAPNSSATVSPESGRSDLKVEVDGWSCGVDVIEDAVATLSELARRAAILSRQTEAGASLSKTPAIVRERDAGIRLRTYDDALRAIADAAPPEIRSITRKEEQKLREFDGFTTLRTYTGGRAAMRRGGVVDGGATEIYLLPDCLQTLNVKALTEQIKSAAETVSELRDKARRQREAVANLAGV